MKYIHRSGLAGLLVLLTAATAAGQQPDTSGTILPDLSPREVEIRGQLEISFPSLRRQPLIGFNPPPRVPDIPPTRRPFIEEYKLASADLPHTPLGQPDPPSVDALTDIEPLNGELEASGGRYLSRILRARLGGRLNGRSALYGRIDYDGSEGHMLRDEVTDLRNPYDGLKALLGYRNAGPRAGWGVELDGALNAYTLYGTNLLDNDSLADQIVLPDRTGLKGGASLWVHTRPDASVATDVRLRYGATRYETDLFDRALNELPPLERKEKRLSGTLNVEVPFSLGAYYLQTDASGAGLDEASVFDFTVYHLNLGTGFRIDIGPKMNLVAGGRYMATSLQGPAGDDLASYLSADAQINVFPAPGLTLYARNKPGVAPNTLWDLFAMNPFVVDRPEMQSVVRLIDAEAGIQLFRGPVQLALRAGFLQSPNYVFFEDEADPPETGYNYRRGIFVIGYRDTEVLTLAGDMSIVILRGLHAKFGVAYRDAELTDTGGHVPYFSPIVSENMLSYNFNNDRMLLQLLASYYSSRYRNRLEDVKVDDFLDVDLVYSYQLNRGLGLVARLNNIVGSRLEHWQHYPESPFTVSAGFRVLW